MVLVLVPNRELRHDICQDVASNVLKTENLLWLGRPPPGRPDGLWDDILDARLKEMQKETWDNLDMIKSQLKLKLEELDDIQPLGPRKWSYITDVFLANVDAAPSAITSFLEVIADAKMMLRAHIELEIAGLVKNTRSLAPGNWARCACCRFYRRCLCKVPRQTEQDQCCPHFAREGDRGGNP